MMFGHLSLMKSKKQKIHYDAFGHVRLDEINPGQWFAKNLKNKLNAILEGTNFTRDLVSEPPNVLNPKNYVQEIKKLSKIGLKVKAYNEKELKKLGYIN